MSAPIFISYRREDTSSEAGRIGNAIRQEFGTDSVFVDTSSIQVGAKWPEEIQSALKVAKTIIVVIGPEWLRVGSNEWGQRRIDQEDDWVRQEVSLALKENKSVLPVLVRGARIPPADALPECINSLSYRQKLDIRNDYWDHDIKLLLAGLPRPSAKQRKTDNSLEETASAIARKIGAFDLVSGILSGQRKAMLAKIESRVKNKVEHGITDQKLFTIRTRGKIETVKTLSAFLSVVKRDPQAELECTEELLTTTKDGIAEYLQDRDGEFRRELEQNLERNLLEIFSSQEFTRIPDNAMTERIRESIKEKIVPKLAEAALTAIGAIQIYLDTLNKTLTATAATAGAGAVVSTIASQIAALAGYSSLIPTPLTFLIVGGLALGAKGSLYLYELSVARQQFAELISKSISTDIDNNHFDSIKNAIATSLDRVIEEIIPELLRPA